MTVTNIQSIFIDDIRWWDSFETNRSLAVNIRLAEFVSPRFRVAFASTCLIDEY